MLMMSPPQITPFAANDKPVCSLVTASRSSLSALPLVVRLTCTSAKPAELDFGENEVGNLCFSIHTNGAASSCRKLSVPSVTFPGKVVITPDHPFEARINLSEIQPQPLPVDLDVTALLVSGINDEELLRTNTLKIKPEQADVAQIRSACVRLATYLQSTVSFEQRAEVASELASVQDPVVIPILASLLEKKLGVDVRLVDGLRRNNSLAAQQVLEAYIPKASDAGSAAYARSALQQMRQKAVSGMGR